MLSNYVPQRVLWEKTSTEAAFSDKHRNKCLTHLVIYVKNQLNMSLARILNAVDNDNFLFFINCFSQKKQKTKNSFGFHGAFRFKKMSQIENQGKHTHKNEIRPRIG